MIDLKQAAAQAQAKPPSSPLKPKNKAELELAKQHKQEETMAARELLEAARVYETGVRSILDLIAPAAFQVKPRFVDLGGRFASTMFVVTYPRYIAVGWFSSIVMMNIPLDVGMFFYPVKAAVILKQLKKKVGALEAELVSDAEKGAPRDPVKETALKDIEQYRES